MTKSAFRLVSFFLLVAFQLFGDTVEVTPGYIHINKHVKRGLRVETPWLFNLNDNLSFAKRELDDHTWSYVKPELKDSVLKSVGFKGKIWFRMHLSFDTTLIGKPIAFSIHQNGASEIYFNGELIKRIGNYGMGAGGRSMGDNELILFIPRNQVGNVLAIRYENMQYDHSYDSNGEITAGFRSVIMDPEFFWNETRSMMISSSIYGMGVFGLFFSIGLIHLLLYLFYRVKRSNLLFALFCFLLSYYFLHVFLSFSVFENPDVQSLNTLVVFLSIPFFFTSILSVMYSLFYDKAPKQFKYIFIGSVIVAILFVTNVGFGLLLCAIQVLVVSFELLRVMIYALRKKLKGSIIITIGFSTFVLFIASFFLIGIFKGMNFGINASTTSGALLLILLVIGIVSIPLSMSVFLAWDFAQTNRVLSKKLVEVEELSARTIEQEKEKQKMLSEQNDKLETQVKERTKEIEEQKKLIEEKNKDITDSINYAQRIQRSILPTASEIKEIFKNAFVLFKPRDIVSGDFYQFKKVDDYRFAIMADCTGHGVPGALMSMIGSNLLNQIIVERKITQPNLILAELNREVKSTLRQGSGAQSHDGMDASVALLLGDKLFISSANRPVYIIQDNLLTEIKPDKRSIGGSQSSNDVDFVVNEIAVKPNMMMYMFSDGYADQFGGETGKKFKIKKLGELFLDIHTRPLDEQHKVLNDTFDAWRNQLEQVDDVCIIGIRL